MEQHSRESILQLSLNSFDNPENNVVSETEPPRKAAEKASATNFGHPSWPDGNALAGELEPVLFVSSTFSPGVEFDSQPPDIVFLSSDAVFFYVHSHQVLSESNNGFCGLLPAQPAMAGLKEDLGSIIPLPENATILNIVLHTIYSLSCAHFSPSLEMLTAAVEALHRYGVVLQRVCTPGMLLYELLLTHAPIAPAEVYSLAGQYDLYDLAVPVSSHLLSYRLSVLSDELAMQMGPVYFKRLFFLHLDRINALSRSLLPPLRLHESTTECGFTEQKRLARAWVLASVYLAWDVRPDMSTSVIQGALCPLGEHLTCKMCREALTERIKQIVVQWSVIKRTI